MAYYGKRDTRRIMNTLKKIYGGRARSSRWARGSANSETIACTGCRSQTPFDGAKMAEIEEDARPASSIRGQVDAL